MILVRRSAADLAAGFAILQSFYQRLKSDWEPRSMRHYASEKQKYLLQKQQSGIIARFTRLFTRPPAKPLRYTNLIDQFYKPIWQQWVQAMRSTPAKEVPILVNDHPKDKFGKQGEQKVLKWLAAHLNDDYLAACRLHMNRRDRADADIIVVGPTGYWYFEVKSWKGLVRGTGDNQWLQRKKSGIEETRTSPIWMWKRVAQELGQVLRDTWQDPLGQIALMRPKGGVIFSVGPAECQLEITDRSRVKWGYLQPCWEKALKEADSLKAATPEQMIGVLDQLLNRHRSLKAEKGTRSMASLAQKLVDQAEDRLNRQIPPQILSTKPIM